MIVVLEERVKELEKMYETANRNFKESFDKAKLEIASIGAALNEAKLLLEKVTESEKMESIVATAVQSAQTVAPTTEQLPESEKKTEENGLAESQTTLNQDLIV